MIARRSLLVAQLLGTAAVLGAAPGAAAQTRADTLPVDQLPARLFDTRDGLPRSIAIYRVRRTARDSTLWLGSDFGAYRFDGRRWVRHPLPDTTTSAGVKDIAVTPDRTRWFAMRTGVVRDSQGVMRWYPLAEPGMRAPVWTLSVTQAFGDSGGTVVAALAEGLARWTGTRFERLPLPGDGPRTNLVAVSTTRGGVGSLWVGSLEGGVMRYRLGRWERFGPADGLPTQLRVQHISEGAPGDRDEVILTAVSGTYAFDGARWRTVHEGGGFHIRSIRVLNGTTIETWTALSSGAVLRQRGDSAWRTVQLVGRQPLGPPESMSVAQDADGNAVVYVGYRSGELARLRLGRVSVVSVPPVAAGRTVRMVHDDADTVYVATAGGIFFRFNGAVSEPISDTLEVNSIERLPAAMGGQLVASTQAQGIWWQRSDGRWGAEAGVPVRAPLTELVAAPGPTGRPTLVVATRAGQLFHRTERGWATWPSSPMFGPIAVVYGNARELWVAAAESIWRWDGRRWTEVPILSGVGNFAIVTLLRQRLRGGLERLWIGSSGGGLRWLDPSLPDSLIVVQRVQLPATVMARASIVRDLQARGDSGLVAASSDGVLLLRLAADGRSARVETSFVEEDGLPSREAMTLARAGSGTQYWVGTLGGLARIEPRITVAEPTRAKLSTRLHPLDSVDVELGTNAKIPWEARALRLEARLQTDYREDEIRYRYQVDDDRRGGALWTDESGLTLRALSAGAHTVRVWAADAHGHEIGPLVREFRILPPFWSSPPMLVLYVLGGSVLVWFITHWRTLALRRRQAELLDNERRLAESEARFRLLFDESEDAQLLADDGIVIAANPAAGRLLTEAGEAELLRSLPIADLLPLLAEGAPDTEGSIETVARTVSRQPRPVQLRVSSFPLKGAVLQHVELRDVRELRRLAEERADLERQLRESQRLEALGTLAGGVAHDFNNLLTVIRNGAEMARDAEQRGEFDPESLEAIVAASTRARDLVRQILAFSRKLPTRADRVDMHALLAELQPMLRATLPSTIRLVLEEQAIAAEVIGDGTQLSQVLLNLCTNAEHAMRRTGQGILTVRTSVVDLPAGARPSHRPLPDGRYLQLTVHDTGHGMSEETRARIFEPFFTTKPVGEGTGLGLSVLHGIIVSHQGSVAVQSAPGEGTTFEVLLPLAAPAAPSVAPPAPAASAPVAGERTRVLLVDDEPMVLAATERILVRFGFEVRACRLGADALAVLEGPERVDVVVTDLTMPEITGEMIAEAAVRLRPGVPVILITGFGGDLSATARAAGVTAVVPKPYELHDLVSVIRRSLGLTPPPAR